MKKILITGILMLILVMSMVSATQFIITVTDEWSGADVNNITVQIGTIGNCYQETANISTTCGGLNTGTYTYENDGYNGNIYINYTKPAGATSAISYFKSFTTNGNYSIPESCFNNNDILQIKMTSVNAGVTGVNSLSCYNGSWNSLYNSGAGSLCGGSFNGGFKNLAIDGNFNTYEQSWAGSLGRHCDVGLDYTAIYEEGIYWYINKTYTNSTGNVITTNIDSSLNYVEDVEISGTNYFSRTYTDYNISADLAAELHQSEVNFQPYQLITNTTISGSNCTINTTTKLCSAEWNLTAGDYDVIVSNVAYYNLTEEVTITTLQSSTINIYELYSSILNITLVNSGNGSSINNFTGYVYNTVNDWNDSFITTNGTAQVNLLDNLTYTVHINGLTNVSNTVEDTILVNGTSDSIELSTYTWNSILINYKDVETLATINNVTLEIISTPYANNYSTTTGSMYLTLLTPTTYTLRYASEGYNNGFYEFTVDDDSGENITLYMMSNSTSDEITVLVYDQSANKVEGATIKALRYDITSNSYLIQSIKTTNSEGEVVMQLQKNTEFYKFIAEYAGETRTTTTPSYITSDQVVIQISLADKLFEEIFEELGIESNLQFEESNDRFKWTYNVPSNILTGEVCLYTYSTSMNNDPVLLNNTCSSSAAGIIYLNIYSPVNGTTYIAKAYYDDTFLQQESYTYGNDLDLGQIGLFIQLLLTIAFISITLWNPALIPIGVSGSLMIGRIVHLTQFGWAPLWVLMVVSIVISYMINRGRT